MKITAEVIAHAVQGRMHHSYIDLERSELANARGLIRDLGAEIERMRAALKPFAAVSLVRELEQMVAAPGMTINLGLMNGNVTQSVIRDLLKVQDFRTAQAAHSRGEQVQAKSEEK